MSRYVLTEVLLDFGRSLWKSPELRGEWSGLPSSGFEAIGQFGIGFFSVFMLGQRVRVATRRYESKEGESEQWLLEFSAGIDKRPILRVPSDSERLKRHGTRLSVFISKEKMLELCPKQSHMLKESPRLTLAQVCAQLAPAIDINLFFRSGSDNRQQVIIANDWKTILPIELLKRIKPLLYNDVSVEKFGHWSHLSELYRSNGNVAGRCAINPGSYFYQDRGIGVVKGLFAGDIEGFAGVVFSKPQNDLARKSTNPDVALTEVQRWSNEQKKLLLTHAQIDEKNSALLARFGADHADLIFGKFGGKSLSYVEFIETVRALTLIKVHDNQVSYDEDDNIIQRDFNNNFEADEYLLELSSQREQDWLKLIDGGDLIPDSWSLDAALESALNEAWGEFNWDDSNEVVGFVDGTEIVRSCRIAVPRSDIELSDL